MFLDAREIDNSTILDTDLCIIGAGAAGISLAREFEGSKLRVMILEGGGLDYDQFSRELYEGENGGTYLSEYSRYVSSTRLRFFGGTTNHWIGWCRPLDTIDFEKRDWVPDSGWPFGEDALKPYYKKAAKLVQISPFDYSPEVELPDFFGHSFLNNSSEFTTALYHFSPPTRFGQTYRDELRDSKNVQVILQANVTDLELLENGSRMSRVEVQTSAKNKFFVRAKYFVLAAGGIENARALLLADKVQPKGIGNEFGLVGRYFMDHPHIAAGYGVFTNPDSSLGYYNFFEHPLTKQKALCSLSLSESAQRSHKLANVCVQFDRPSEIPPEVQGAAGLFEKMLSFTERSSAKNNSSQAFLLYVRSEQEPNPESRVSLCEKRDVFGLRQVKLDWRLTQKDGESIRKTIRLLATELGRVSAGRVKLFLSEENPWPGGWFGAHHMGTTRMHQDPRRGVVDGNCRMHSVENIYLAGSSVFPTCGTANPTFTILALTLRLADHLKGVIRI